MKVKITYNIESWLNVTKNKIYEIHNYSEYFDSKHCYGFIYQVVNNAGKIVDVPEQFVTLIQ